MVTEENAAGRMAPPPRYDEAAFEQKKKAIDAEIKQLQKQMDAVEGSDFRNSRSELNQRRDTIKNQVSALRRQRNELSDECRKLGDKAREMSTEARKESDDVQKLSRKFGYSSVETIAADIQKLEKRLQAGLASLAEEKKITNEISQLKRSQKQVADNEARRSTNELEWKAIQEVRAKQAQLNAKRDELQQQIDEYDSAWAAFDEEKKIIKEREDERRNLKSSLDDKYRQLRDLRSERTIQKSKRRQWEQAEQERRSVLLNEQRRQEELARRTAAAQREREMADIPAYTEEISRCESILTHLKTLSGKTTSNVSVSNNPRDYSNVTNLPEGAKLLKKGNDMDYMVLGGGSKKDRKNKKTKDNQINGSEEASKVASKRPIKHDLLLVDEFNKLNIALPSTVDQLPTAIKALEDKVSWFKERQVEETEKNKQRVEARLNALLEAEAGSAAPAKAEAKILSSSAPDKATEGQNTATESQ